MKAIPVLGALVYNRGDLLTRMVRSIDYPVDQLVIVLNGVDESVAESADIIRGLYPSVVIYNPGFNQSRPVNLGCAGGWNFILRNFMKDWVMLVGSDVTFHAGQLAKMVGHYEAHKDDSPPVGIVHSNWGFNCIGITKHGIDAIGYFDEGFFPIYFEDTDYCWRHTLARKQGLLSYPAEGECVISIDHEVSATNKNLPTEKAQRMNQATQRNEEYFKRKWGGPQCHEVFEHPFNNPALSIRDWALEPGRHELNSLD